MLKSCLKVAVFLLALFVAMAPIAEASMVVFAAPGCAAMMGGAEKSSCCGSDCNCSIETRTTDLSSVIPVSLPRFELTADKHIELSSATQIEPVTFEKSASESPPSKEPLYQIYSDYRL